MHKQEKVKSLRLTLISSLCLGAVVTFAAPAKADGSFPDISGTNVWNNTAPIFDRGGGGIDPELVERARRLNQEADQAYKACDAAVLAAQQGGTRGPRQFLRNPENTDAEFPVACQRLNELTQEAANLRSQLEAAARSGGSPMFRTW